MLPGEKRRRSEGVKLSFRLGGIDGRKMRGKMMADNKPYFSQYLQNNVWLRYGKPPRRGEFRLYNYCQNLYVNNALRTNVKVRSHKWFKDYNETEYEVTRRQNSTRWRCSCPDTLKCKHIFMVEEIIRRRGTGRRLRSGRVYLRF